MHPMDIYSRRAEVDRVLLVARISEAISVTAGAESAAAFGVRERPASRYQGRPRC
jgi:hypothetical protein